MQLDEPFREELNNPRRTTATKTEVFLLPFQFLRFLKKLLNSLCDCQQSQVSTRERFKIYLHYSWSWLLKEKIITSYYEVEAIGKRKATEEIQSDKERHLQTLCDLRAWRTEKLKDDRSEWIDVNLMHSDTPMFNFFWEAFTNEIKQSRILRKNLTEYKSPWVKRIRTQ